MSHASQPPTVSSLLHDDQSSSPSIDSHATATAPAAAVDSAPSSQETSKTEDERCISVHSTSPSSQTTPLPSSIDMDSSAPAVEAPAVHSSLFGSSSVAEAVNEALEKVGSELHDLSAAVVAPVVADTPATEARAEEPAAHTEQPEPAPAAQSSSLFSGFSSAFNAMATKVGSALSGTPAQSDSAEADSAPAATVAPAQEQAQPAAADTPAPAAAAQTHDESSDAADPTTPTQAGFDADSNGFHLPKATELEELENLVQVVSGFIGGQPIIDSVLGDPKHAQEAEEKVPEPVILQKETAAAAAAESEHKEDAPAPAQEESKEETPAAPAQPFDPWFDRAPEEAKEESNDAPKDALVEESCVKELDDLVQVVSGIVGGQPIIDSVLGDPKPAQEEEEKVSEPVILQQETAEFEHKEAAPAPAQEESKEETPAAPAQPFDPWFDRAPEEAPAEKKEAEETHSQPQEASAEAEKAPAQPFDPWFDRAPEEKKEESHDAPKDAPVEEPCVKEEAVLQFAEEAAPAPAVCPAAPHDHELPAAQDLADHALQTDPPVQTLTKELDEAAPVEEQAPELSAVEKAATPTSDAASEESFELVHQAPQGEKSDEDEFHDAHEDHEEEFATGETPEPFEEVSAHEEPKAAKEESHAQEAHAEPEHKEETHEEPKAAQEEAHAEPEHKEEAPAQEAHAEPEHKEEAHEEPKAAQEEEKIPEPVLHQETHAEPEHKEEAHEEPKAAQEEAHAEPEHKEEAPAQEAHAEPEHKEMDPTPAVATLAENHEEPKAAHEEAPAHEEEEEKIPEPVLHQESHAEPAAAQEEEVHEVFDQAPPQPCLIQKEPLPEHPAEQDVDEKIAEPVLRQETHAEPEHKEESHEEPKAAQEEAPAVQEAHAEPEKKEMDPTPAEVTPAETKEEAAAADEQPKAEDAEEESFSKVTVAAVAAAAAAGVAVVAAAASSSSEDASPILADSHGEKDVGEPSSHTAETQHTDEAFDAHDDEGQSSSRKKREAGFTDDLEEEATVVEVQGLQTESPSNGEVQVFEDRVDDEEDPEDDRVPVKTLFDRSVKKPVPYRSLLQEKIEPGQTLIVKGSTIDESQRFTINLHSKSADFSGNDVPLHISFRFDEGKVVMNTFHNGEWGKEERKSNPLKKGDSFDIRIRAHDDRFQVVIDQKEFRDFEHRLPLTSISHLSIDGDLYLNHVHWGGKYYPVPYESGIANGFPVGKSLLVFGAVEKKGKRFNINLLRKNGDIALHFNPRCDEKVVVRNSLEENQWGNEEREGKNPFEKGMGFDLAITNEAYAFQIFVNGERFATFAHRTDPNDITGLQIQGDIELTGIQIQ